MPSERELGEHGEEERPKGFPTHVLMLVICWVIVVAAYFALKTIADQTLYAKYLFYIILGLSGHCLIFATLLFCLMFHRSFGIVWWKNFDKSGAMYYGFGLGISLLLQYFLSSWFNAIGLQLVLGYPFDGPASLPLPPTLAVLPQGFSNLVQEIFWQSLSVGHSEEIFKIGIIVAGAAVVGKNAKLLIFATIADLVWAFLHSMISYGNDLGAVAVAAIIGVVMLWQFYQTKSIIPPILTHATLNVVYRIPALGLTWASLGIGTIQSTQTITALLHLLGLG